MDHSVTRRGQPCWYKIPQVGLMAVNDCCILEGTIYRLLKRYLRHLPNYDCLVDLFHEVREVHFAHATHRPRSIA